MPSSQLDQQYGKLAAVDRHIVHLYALSGECVRITDLPGLSKQIGWTNSQGKSLARPDVTAAIKRLVKKGLLNKQSYGAVRIAPDVEDLVVQDSISHEWFEPLAQFLQDKFPRNDRFADGTGRQIRDLRVAFYESDVDAVQSLAKTIPEANLLDPFNQELYDQLDPILQEMYLCEAIPNLILRGAGAAQLVTAFDNAFKSSAAPSDDMLATAVDIYVAAGRIEALQDLQSRTKGKLAGVEGCTHFLQGDYERAEACFAKTMSVKTRGGKAGRSTWKRLPGLLYLVLLIRRNSAESRQVASSLVSSLAKTRQPKYESLLPIFAAAVEFQAMPTDTQQFCDQITAVCNSNLGILFAGYVWNWHITADDKKVGLSGMSAAAEGYQRVGLEWLAAEISGLSGKSSLKTASRMATAATKKHKELGTSSLVDSVRPVEAWERSLMALRQLGDGASGARKPQAFIADQRMIWELGYCTKWASVDFRPVVQKRTAKGWSKGRPVSLERLAANYRDPEFAFLTDEDVALCKSLRSDTSRNHYGYTETTYFFDYVQAARAAIGHPCIFGQGKRDQPLEIVEQEAHLVVTKTKGRRIAISLHPKPRRADHDDGPAIRLTEEGPRRLAITFVNQQHHQLEQILGDELVVPSSAAKQVTESLKSLATLVPVHSQIGMGDGDAGTESVQAECRPHVHLLPYYDGLELKLYVRPFGDDGPFFPPGEGAETVVAKVGGKTQSARRDLKIERERKLELLAACPSIGDAADDGSVCFEWVVQALEVLLDLEPLVDEGQVALHWPQGQSFQVAGQADTSQLQVQIRKDRDWFAASGTLKVDKNLTLDMMRLIELVEASPSRFVELDQGRFLALTDQLRRRIEEFAAYGDRVKNKLRFPPIRAAALEDFEEAITLKADQHWKQCVERMRTAGKVNAEVPSTMLADLRDYQQEGFQWLARLAEWGAGACLADDMGLGKTIQALALLLLRSGDGPALVVAPTSVAYNWQSEILRFAPTLNVRLFGDGDRRAALQDLGPRDVVICSYGLLHSEAKRITAEDWHTVVLDEAQAIKNIQTKRAQAAMNLKADFRLIMTGTPLENHLGELWSLFQFINPGLLGSLDSFQERFATPIERDQCRDTRRRLKKLIQPFILRRTKTQVLEELPSRTEITLKVDLSVEEAAFYEALRERAVETLAKNADGGGKHVRIFAELMKLRRACCHPQLVMKDISIASSKLELFSKTIGELLENKHKVLVFSQFVDHLKLLRKELDSKEVSYQYLDGSTTAKQRKKRVEAFQAGEGDVFLISLKAGGVGLNLTAADYVIHMDPWWNPAVEDQASDRAHRLGQQRAVTIYRFITTGTIEERIAALHATKRDLADTLLEGTEMTGKLSAEELMYLIRD